MTCRIGVVGTGWGARVQVPCFRAAGLEVAALWAHSEEKARDLSIELAVPMVTTDYAQLLEEGHVDLVSLTTPPAQHREMTGQALAAGKHVLCEKPMALDAVESAAMVAAAEAAGPRQLAFLDHELRFLPSLQELRRRVQAGELGELFHLQGLFLDGGRLDPSAPWNWWSDASRGGGLLGAIGSHLVDLLTWLTGLSVESVVADLRPGWRQRRIAHSEETQTVTADDYGALLLRFAGGCRGVVELSTLSAGSSGLSVRLHGSAGSLSWQDGLLEEQAGDESQVILDDRPREILAELPEKLSGELRPRPWEAATLVFARELRRAFADGPPTMEKRGRLAPAADFTSGLAVQRVLDAARDSVTQRRWIDVPRWT
ncbi:MAG: Gfo/Idh/MocA family oxidoreductase [Acidobacteriota bacterium]|nr:Gfo/Idh/MocA family oxidoreductase [Acidobacteriota bacterium]